MTIETRQKVISWSKWLLGMWIVFTALAVLACGHPLLSASTKVGCYVLSVGLWALAFEAVAFGINRFPRAKHLVDKVVSTFSKLVEFSTPEKLDAWSAKAVVTLVGGIGVFILIATASSGWLAMLTGLLASIALGVALWIMMSLVDMLQKWAERTDKKFYGALILLTALGAFWFALVLTMNWLSGTTAFIWT